MTFDELGGGGVAFGDLAIVTEPGRAACTPCSSKMYQKIIYKQR